MTLPEPPLMLITDRRMARRPLQEVVAEALVGGCRWVMVREKDLADDQLTVLVKDMIVLAREHGATVSVNGHAAVAAACGAHGIHLPRDGNVIEARRISGRATLIGVSAHSLAEAHRAAEEGADYITLSPVFLTDSKPGYGPALGLEELRRVATSLRIPVVALGGITPPNAADCMAAGAAAVAVMGAIMRAADPEQVVRELLRGLDERKRKT